MQIVVCPCYVRVCIYIVFLTAYDRRIRFYSIMQLACVFKYILEFGTLAETTPPRRTHHIVFFFFRLSFFHSELRSRSPILTPSASREAMQTFPVFFFFAHGGTHSSWYFEFPLRSR